jgi:hypothetical protein
MAECKLLSKCPFFNDKLKDMPTVTDMMKRMYCLGHYEQCARHRVATALGRKKTPVDLFPYDTIKAKILLKQYV